MEHKAMLETILAHQLEGIMFHHDCSIMYKLFGMCGMARKHYNQLLSETEAHSKTNFAIIEMMGEVVYPADTRQRIRITSDKPTTAPTMAERQILHAKAITSWYEWEKQTVAMYRDAVEKMPDCKLWKWLMKCAEKEVVSIERMM